MILSVIIPCYNHGQYIQEAIDSVLTYQDQPIEIIIIDDGSTDGFTISKIEELKQKGFKVIQHPNSGLAFSRNAGIFAAKGKYILPLDADNKIKAEYIRQALALLEDDECDIVYAKPRFFGDDIAERKFSTRAFNGPDIFFGNYIDACSIFKKDIWNNVGGYDEHMPFQGQEDWDFWINSYIMGYRFEFIDEELFKYRINRKSMIASIIENKLEANQNYVLVKYKRDILKLVEKGYCYQQFHENDQRNLLRASVKYFIKYFRSFFR